MYKVIRYFTDLQDNEYAYHVGDTFPHEGLEVSAERLAELSSDKNKRHIPLIEKVKTEPEDVINPPEEGESKEKVKKPSRKANKKG